jgi:glycosyltransferase involved in cell wall biosynthesis
MVKLPVRASAAARAAIGALGRTEDVKVSPAGDRVAIAGFAKNEILLLDLEGLASGTAEVGLTNPVSISSPDLASPHGMSFLDDTTLIVANREGTAPVLRLPDAGAAAGGVTAPTLTVIGEGRWLHSPGSVCCYESADGVYTVCICNNYASYVTRHVLHCGDQLTVSDNALLLARGLDVPDGIAVCRSCNWIAISNHIEQSVRIYDNCRTLDRDSEPSCFLRGSAYPHGLVFSPDERCILVADAGSPFLRIYRRPGKTWQGELQPFLSLRVMSDEEFRLGSHNPMEGGLKGIDLIPGTNIMVATTERLPLVVYDLEKVLPAISAARTDSAQALFGGGRRCPCGSKKVFRKCCGAKRTIYSKPEPESLADILKEAVMRMQLNELEKVEALCKRALRQQPDDPRANHMLGYVYYKWLRYQEASVLMRRAGLACRWQNQMIRSHYASVLKARLLGEMTAQSAALSCRYRAWLDSHGTDPDYQPLVSVVMVTHDAGDLLEQALASVYAQTYDKLELIVVDTGPDQGSRLLERLTRCPIPYRIESASGQSPVQALNTGCTLAKGDFINPLDPEDMFQPERIAALVEGIARRGFQWGFSRCEFIDDDSRPLNEDDSKYVSLLTNAVESALSADTLGASLTGLLDPYVSPGNLFFSRSLFAQAGGFYGLEKVPDRDFSLRALWYAEPVLVPSPLYQYRLLRKHAQGRYSEAAQQEMERILVDFCRRAESEQPVNPFAPARSTVGYAYLSGALIANQSRLPPERLVALDDELLALEAAASKQAPGNADSGLNLVGYFRAETGLGEAVRTLAESCRAGGIDVCLHDAGVELGSPHRNRSVDHLLSTDSTHGTTLFYINPDRLEAVWRRYSRKGDLEGRRVIGCWHWEIERFPRTWLPAIDLVDELWVTSAYVAGILRQVTDKPITLIPPAIDIKLSHTYSREAFFLPEGDFLFLSSFDFGSYPARKNPQAAIEAFRRAFPPEVGATRLVVKCLGSARFPAARQELETLVRDDPRIVILDRHLSREDMYGLQSVCDAYVSLHRAEGFGLALAECMALGKPVVATAYSGNLDFMSAENSCLVDYTLIPVKPGEYLQYEPGWVWADPDIDEAARHLRRLAENPALCKEMGERARHDINTRYTREAMNKAVRHCLTRCN